MSYTIKNGANLGLTQTEIDALTPREGDVVFNKTTVKLQFYDGVNWVNIEGGGASPGTTIFSEDWESGIGSWVQVDDPSAVSTINQDLVISGATNAVYDQTYPVYSLVASISDAGIVSTSINTGKTFVYDAGGGTWYLAIYNYNFGNWHIRTTTTDPSTITDGTDLSSDTNIEVIANFSEQQDGLNVPFTQGVVSYAGGTSSSVNNWVLGTATAQEGTHSMYITNDGGTTNEVDNSVPATAHVYHDVTMPADVSGGVTLEFYYKSMGEANYDKMRVYVTPDTLTPTGGIDNSQSYNIGGTNFDYNLVGIYVQASVDISSLVSANTTYRLVFTWINDNFGSNTQPPASIDDIKVIA